MFILSAQTSISNIINDFKNIDKTKKMLIVTGITFVIISILVSIIYLNNPTYEVLFSQLRDSDPSSVTNKLNEINVKYKIKEESDGSITILVPKEDKARARVDVSATFSPTGGTIGYESLDKISFGETENDRQHKRKIALEGELTKTLQLLPSVNWARVHLDVPEKSILKVSKDDEDVNASASVTLGLNSSSQLSTNQIKGIIKMISNSVSSLKPENVEVLDENMNLLSEGLFDGDSNLITNEDNSKIKKNIEKDLSSKTKRLLEAIVGVGNVAVEVDTQMNFDVSEVVENKFGKSTPLSEKVIEKNNVSNSGTGDILPGVDTNSDTEDYKTSNSNTHQSESYVETITNYETEKTTSKTIKSPGEIERLTVSVVINEDALKDDSGNIDQNLKNELLQNAKTSVGFNQERKDEIQFTIVPFSTPVEEKTFVSTVLSHSSSIYMIIITILVFLFVFFTSRKALSLLSKSTPSAISLNGEFVSLSSNNTSNTSSSASINNASESDDDDDDFMPLTQEVDVYEKRIGKIIDNDPEPVRKVLRHYKKNN